MEIITHERNIISIDSVTRETVRVPGGHFITHSVLTIWNVSKTCQRIDIMHRRLKILLFNTCHGKKQYFKKILLSVFHYRNVPIEKRRP